MKRRVDSDEKPSLRCKQRQRRPHKKSRDGCANCRLRRVKCDEGRPSCRRCQEYMTPCSYGAANLSNTGEQVFDAITQPSTSQRTSHGLLTLHPSPEWHHEILFRFSNRTVLSMGSANTIFTYAKVVPRLAIQHEHLFHMVIATTLLHDRALNESQSTTSESYHLSHAASMFNLKLSTRIADTDKDAIWATAAYMCATSVFNIGSLNVEEAWPLKKHPDDLKWLNLQAGLRVIWSLTDLHRPNGLFADVGEHTDENCVFPRTPQPGIVGLPPLLIALCGLSELSNGTNNPYHTAVRYLSWLLSIKCSSTNMLSFMIFAGGMTPAYRDLLHQKDPRALLLMGIWYSRVLSGTWWMIPRASIESQAIYRYLDRLQINDTIFQKVLGLLGRACELHRSMAPASNAWTFEPYDTRHLLPATELISFD